MLGRVMPAGVPVPADSIAEIARLVRAAGGAELADRLERALADKVKLLALTTDERMIILSQLDDPPAALAELRGRLMSEHEYRLREGIET